MRHMVVPLGSCLPTGFFPVLRTLRKHLGRRDGIANQRGLFQSESSWCCWPVSELTSTSRACAGSEGRNIIGGAPCPTSNCRGWLAQPRLLYGHHPGPISPHTKRRARESTPARPRIYSSAAAWESASARPNPITESGLPSIAVTEEERGTWIGCVLPQ
jgi:hypothetical protein